MKLETFYDGCATHYDADYAAAGYHHDIPFYVEIARETAGKRAGAEDGAVLEMGCGTGRVLIEIARAGVEIVGVELSAGMLRAAEGRLADQPAEVRDRTRLIPGDIRTVDLGRRFSLVTAPFRVVQHLVDRADQKAWLANVRRHLEPGGRLVFDVFQPDYDLIADSPFLTVDVERTDPATGRRIRRVSRSEHYPELQTFDVTFEWLVEGEDGTETVQGTVHQTVRWFTRSELENLLELQGFEVLDVWGDFDRTPFGPHAEDIILHARRND